jgi:hypothetical protein
MTDDNVPRGRRGGWRAGQRPVRPEPAHFADDGPDAPTPRAPMMSRSRTQLSTSYAPGVLFTWEGAKGICRSVPIERELRDVPDATRLLIMDGIREIASNWVARGLGVRDDMQTSLLLDDVFFDQRTGLVDLNWQQNFQLTDPGVMGYVPYPLLYRCGVCGHLEEFESIDEQVRRPLRNQCNGHLARWSQVDVVYAHWSGAVEPLNPFRNNFDAARGVVAPVRQCQCGGRDFRLNNHSPKFSDWEFVCESCGATRDLQKADRLTLTVLENTRRDGGRVYQRIEVNMLPVSYRANATFYPQRGAFIEFRDRSVVDLLLPERQPDLLRALAVIHAIPFREPTELEIELAVTAANRSGEWADYTELLRFAAQATTPARAEALRRDAAQIRDQWFKDDVVSRGAVQSPALAAAVATRADWARRYDPLRLSLEHSRFAIEHIEERRPRHEAVNVMEPDRLISEAVGNPTELTRYQTSIGGLLNRIGVAQLHLIRGLPICEFSFGFTRVSATPVYTREFNGRGYDMPVRLNAFPELPNHRRPVYVTQQRNEALYFKLDPARVFRWLQVNGIADLPGTADELGRAYLEQYPDFRPFMDEFKDRIGRAGGVRALPPFVYLLVHSLAHQVMHSMADTSGLDRDALGEYLFPADLAFVVYRKGMTPDLGNISSMWRNYASDFLNRVLDPRMLRCGSGTLCDTRGGACPACIMVSEITCIASNQLLSRASLRGGPHPLWESPDSPQLIGFFDPRVMQ